MMEFFAMVAVAALLALWPAGVAARKGRSRFGWWVGGTLLWIVALPASYLVSDVRRRCPVCAEPVHDAASACPHCQRKIGWA